MKPVFPTSVLFFLGMILMPPTLILSLHKPIRSTDHEQIKNYIHLELPAGVVGPESFGFDCHGKGPYIGVSDGRILKWEGLQLGWKEFAINSAKRQARYMFLNFLGVQNSPCMCSGKLFTNHSLSVLDLFDYLPFNCFKLRIKHIHGMISDPLPN